MRKYRLQTVISLSAVVLTTAGLAGGTALANIQTNHSNSGVKLAWVMKDVTAQDHYKITYDTYNSSHQLVSSKTVSAPAGSLVEVTVEPLQEAKAGPYLYAPKVAGESKSAVVNKLHRELYQALNPTQTTTNLITKNAISTVTPNSVVGGGYTNKVANGSFSGGGQDIGYSIHYTVYSGGSVAVAGEYLTQTGGADSLNWYESTWAGHSWVWSNSGSNIIPYSPNSDYEGFNWDGSTGYGFATYVQDLSSGVSLYGYTTLY